MCMIGRQRPGMAIRSCLKGSFPHSGYRYIAIFIVGNELSFFDTPYHHMMQCVRRIESRTSRQASSGWLVFRKDNAALCLLQLHDFRNVPHYSRESAIKAGIVEQHVFDQGIKELYRSAEPDGVFCYTFFKAVGIK